MSQIDWSKAPEWATVRLRSAYDETLLAWAESYQEDVRFKRDDYDQSCSYLAVDCWTQIAMRPSVQDWTGTGLPPVGVACESLWNESGNQWLKVKIFAVNEHGQPIHRWEEGPKAYEYQASPLTGMTGNPYFRPIRTPEQIAAEEREAAVQAMLDGYSYPNSDIARAVCGYIYDAGYRKQSTKQDGE